MFQSGSQGYYSAGSVFAFGGDRCLSHILHCHNDLSVYPKFPSTSPVNIHPENQSEIPLYEVGKD